MKANINFSFGGGGSEFYMLKPPVDKENTPYRLVFAVRFEDEATALYDLIQEQLHSASSEEEPDLERRYPDHYDGLIAQLHSFACLHGHDKARLAILEWLEDYTEASHLALIQQLCNFLQERFSLHPDIESLPQT